MANARLRRDAWSRIQVRARAIDSEFGAGGEWYKEVARSLVRRARSGRQVIRQDFYLDGINFAANTISAALQPESIATPPDEMEFLHRYANLAHPRRITADAARRMLNEQVDAVLLPKQGAAESVLPGVHVPVRFDQTAGRLILDDPAVVLGAGTYKDLRPFRSLALQASPIVNVDVASLKVRVAEAGGSAESSVGSIEWNPSQAKAWVDGLITSRYEAAQVTARGIDVFDERISPVQAQTHAYRFGARVSDATAQRIRRGYHRYQADLKDGVVDQQSLTRAINASRSVISHQPPEVRAGAQEMIDILSLGAGEIPASAVRAGLNAVADDLFEAPSAASAGHLSPVSAGYGRPLGSEDDGEPRGSAKDGVPLSPGDAGVPPSSGGSDELPGPSEQRVLEVESTGSLAELEVTVFAAVTPQELLSPSSRASSPFVAELDHPVIISSSAEGFVTDDQTWVQVQLESGKRSPTVAFRYRVKQGAERFAITVTVRQLSAELGRVTLREFAKTERKAAALDDDPRSVDVSIAIDDDGIIRLFTPDGSYRGHPLEAPLSQDEAARALVDRFVEAAVSVADESPADVEEGLMELALDVKNALPGTLIDYLEQTEDLNVLIDYPVTWSFPFEIALLERPDGDRRLLGEVHNVTRWPSCATDSPSYEPRVIGRAAFISDPQSLADSEDAVESHRTTLRRVCPTEDYHDLKTVRESVFQATTFGLLDFVTHMGSQQGQVGLSIGGKILRPNAFFKKDMLFGNTATLVFVNACSSILAAAQFYSPKSFPQQFIDFHVPVVVASVLPVEPDLALKFGSYFYAALDAGDSIGNALRSARNALMADNSAEFGAERRRLAAAAYCLFGHPMMPVKFERGADQ